MGEKIMEDWSVFSTPEGYIPSIPHYYFMPEGGCSPFIQCNASFTLKGEGLIRNSKKEINVSAAREDNSS